MMPLMHLQTQKGFELLVAELEGRSLATVARINNMVGDRTDLVRAREASVLICIVFLLIRAVFNKFLRHFQK